MFAMRQRLAARPPLHPQQGLTLVHFSAHHERFLQDTLGGTWSFSDENGSG
jgi:hypothetical protein